MPSANEPYINGHDGRHAIESVRGAIAEAMLSQLGGKFDARRTEGAVDSNAYKHESVDKLQSDLAVEIANYMLSDAHRAVNDVLDGCYKDKINAVQRQNLAKGVLRKAAPRSLWRFFGMADVAELSIHNEGLPRFVADNYNAMGLALLALEDIGYDARKQNEIKGFVNKHVQKEASARDGRLRSLTVPDSNAERMERHNFIYVDIYANNYSPMPIGSMTLVGDAMVGEIYTRCTKTMGLSGWNVQKKAALAQEIGGLIREKMREDIACDILAKHGLQPGDKTWLFTQGKEFPEQVLLFDAMKSALESGEKQYKEITGAERIAETAATVVDIVEQDFMRDIKGKSGANASRASGVLAKIRGALGKLWQGIGRAFSRSVKDMPEKDISEQIAANADISDSVRGRIIEAGSPHTNLKRTNAFRGDKNALQKRDIN